jgi:hypothetical protein
MDKLIKRMKELSLSYDIMNTVLGILLLIFLFLGFRHPQNSLFLMIAFAVGGAMNVVNGLKYKKDPKRKNLGIPFILFGIIVIFIGYLLVSIK